ncbi:phosphate transport system permease protein PstA [Flexivirga endophytica]|uniref:Phosphate transport system permease protein PstA n=1 Tax=Flexivirga endophytica TaxID=1849103 RepID=A0A916TFR6_9MICO|nr:phosphate ABC transporter permease PstA [Flexivirga endophytica]GGB43386.1 phosphate transport system permease protein PstA [Flexivirga endophytica]GHB68463.1 phosphate transport system permease protein PstA [Flexivirga endophytica]
MSIDTKEIAPAPTGDLGGLAQGRSGLRTLKNSIAGVVIWGAFLIALIPLGWILWTVLSRGLSPMLDATWWQKDQSGVGAPGFDHNVRGARHAIVGTLMIALGTSVIAIPIAVMTAIYLVEYGRGGAARAISFMVDILSGVPSIVAGLFIYAIWVTFFGWQLNGFGSSLALVLLMVPVVCRSTEEMLKLVPNELREASYALGVPKWKTIVKVVLPTSFSGIVTGSLLGFARVAGETAPLLILAQYSQFLNQNLFSGNIAALPTLINTNLPNMAGDPVSADRVWGAACTLILLVLVINLIGRLIGHFTKVKG